SIVTTLAVLAIAGGAALSASRIISSLFGSAAIAIAALPSTTQARGTVTVGTAGHLLRIRCMFPDPSLFGVRRVAERCSSDCHKPTFPGWGELSALSKSSLDPPRHRFQRLTDVPRLPRVVFCSRAGASLALKPEGVSALNGGAARTKASWRR